MSRYNLPFLEIWLLHLISSFTDKQKQWSFSGLAILFSVLLGMLSAQSSFEVENEALKEFKKGVTRDPLGALVDWSDSTHHCNWTGIKCHPSSRRVVSISLAEMQLTGDISPFLGNLSRLQVLYLTHNSFIGHVPLQLGLCHQLSELSLFNNSLSGPIPPELGNLESLQLLDLGNNLFNGTIPERLCHCTALIELYLSFNHFTCTIPSNIGNLSRLQIFVASANSLTGPIPASIGELSDMLALDLSENQISGELPPHTWEFVELRTHSVASEFQFRKNPI